MDERTIATGHTSRTRRDEPRGGVWVAAPPEADPGLGPVGL